MLKLENSIIPFSVEIDLTGISTNGILTEINWISETPKFLGNLTEILTEMLNGNKYEISRNTGITGNNQEISKRNGNSGQNPGNSGQST